MANIEVLRQRVEDAERRLHSVQSTRERECEALMEMWERIRARFQEQEREIADHRSRLSALQDVNVELTSMIDSMLGSIEGSVTRSLDRALPDIAGMAKELLKSEPASQASSIDDIRPDPEADIAGGLDPPLEPGIRLAGATIASGSQAEKAWSGGSETVARDDRDEEPADVTMSIPECGSDEILELTEQAELDPADAAPGIRNLISRIERAVNKASGTNGGAGGEGSGRNLAEIEHLRSELNGLRQRISAAGAAE